MALLIHLVCCYVNKKKFGDQRRKRKSNKFGGDVNW